MIEHLLSQTAHILTKTQSGGWDNDEEWTIKKTIPTLIRYLSGSEGFADGTRKLLTTHRAYTREELSINDRLQCDGKVYRIVLVYAPIGAGFYQVDLEYLPDEEVIQEEEEEEDNEEENNGSD